MRAVLELAREEIAGLVESADNVQKEISELLDQVILSSDSMVRLQAIDRLGQRLAALERFFAALGRACEPGWTLGPPPPALAALSARLPAAGVRNGGPNDHEGGECEFL